MISIINKINEQKNLVELNLNLIRNNKNHKNYGRFLVIKKNLSKKIAFLVNLIRNLKKKIKKYKNEA
jgi:hypothetical protein